MPPKYLHACERCGLQAALERVGRYRDEDYLELWHEHMEALQRIREIAQQLHTLQQRLFALECDKTAALNDLAIATWQQPQPETVEAEGDPFA